MNLPRVDFAFSSVPHSDISALPWLTCRNKTQTSHLNSSSSGGVGVSTNCSFEFLSELSRGTMSLDTVYRSTAATVLDSTAVDIVFRPYFQSLSMYLLFGFSMALFIFLAATSVAIGKFALPCCCQGTTVIIFFLKIVNFLCFFFSVCSAEET